MPLQIKLQYKLKASPLRFLGERKEWIKFDSPNAEHNLNMS